MRSICFLARFFTGVCAENPCARATFSTIRIYHGVLVPVRDHGRMAPSAMLKRLFGITRSGSTSSFVPRPVHVGHAPCGELNENSRGSSSGRLMLHNGHAKCSENTLVSSLPPATDSTMSMPSPKSSAVSTDCARRDRSPPDAEARGSLRRLTRIRVLVFLIPDALFLTPLFCSFLNSS